MRSARGLSGLVVVSLLMSGPVHAAERTFAAGSLIVPMDLAYQSDGLYQAYGLLFQLLRQGVPVHWVIKAGKTWHAARCDAAGDACAWDCAEEGSGTKCDYPTSSPDFYAGANVLWDDQGAASAGAVIANHGYRGGPFVVDVAHRERALAVINAWNDPNAWNANAWARRGSFKVVTVHQARADFTANSAKELVAAPTIAIFADGNEDIATAYLRAAGIKQSNGAEFPSAKCGAGTCGPGTANPDLLTVPSIMGDMGTCDAPDLNHKNGALFTADGLPAYCQIMSMHWNVSDRETVECGGTACPATAAQCAGVPITYHGHEVVAEVRSFLQYPTHFFAECQAVNAYENMVPNPAWPFLDDAGRLGHFLTTTGNPPACPCTPASGEGSFSCVTDGCGPGVDCCLPSDDREKGAGFLITSAPSPFKILRPDVPYMQFDGVFSPEGGSEPAYNLSAYLGSRYKNDRDVTFITGLEGPGTQDVWMTGYLDGACDVAQWPPRVNLPPNPRSPMLPALPPRSCGGKVSYLGGHSYASKPGQRLFLNALFEADCVEKAAQPRLALSLRGELIVAAQHLPVEREYFVDYLNLGDGLALDAILSERVTMPAMTVVAVDIGATVSAEGAAWSLGSLSGTLAQPGDPPTQGSRGSTIRFDEYGDFELSLELEYRVGLSTLRQTEIYPIQVLLDTDGDGAADDLDDAPEDGTRCGDWNGDGCDDCASGSDPAGGQCGGPSPPPAGGAAGANAGGCGCRTMPGAVALVVPLAALSALLRVRRRRG